MTSARAQALDTGDVDAVIEQFQRSGHLVCDRCGSVIDVPSRVFASVGRSVRDAFGFSIGDQHFPVTGTCADCRKR